MKIKTLIMQTAALGYLVSLTACGAAIGLGTSASSQSGTIASDFGDAPDNLDARYGKEITAQFPSRLASNGAHHTDTTKAALGLINENGEWPSTTETDAVDPADTDSVQNIDEEPGASDNDHKDDGLLTLAFGDDEDASLQFAVTAADDSPQDTYYINVLFDWNKDGQWSGKDSNGAEEWAVKNHQVTVMPGEAKVDRTELFTTGVSAQPVWVRLTISEVPIDESAYPNGWDGTGTFALGETEDYLLTNNQVLDLNDDGNGLPGVLPNPFNPKPLPPVGGGGGGGGGACDQSFFMNLTLCKGRSTTKLVTIGGFAPDSISATSDDSSVASVSLNESNVTITGNAEGVATINIVATQGGCTYYLTVRVKVQICQPARKVRIECGTLEDIRRDPSQCKNCHVVGRQHNQSNTYGGGGTIPEVDMEGIKTSVSKSFVIVRSGGLVDVVTLYYECDPCDDGEEIIDETDEATDEEIEDEQPMDFDSFFDLFFDSNDEALFGGENGLIDNFDEYDNMTETYDDNFDESIYECATRHFEEAATEN